MKALRIASVLWAAALAVLALLPASGNAQYVVPPDNSAVNQYTETVPTAGGGHEPGKGNRSPSKALGSRNANQLNAQGADGRAAAELAAATAPGAPAGTPSDSVGEPGGSGQGGPAKTKPDGASPPASATRTPAASDPGGASGLGEVISQATGASSSGETGVLLPIVVLAALAWSIGYFWRQRRRID
jgi:hypothetical protein